MKKILITGVIIFLGLTGISFAATTSTTYDWNASTSQFDIPVSQQVSQNDFTVEDQLTFYTTKIIDFLIMGITGYAVYKILK